MYGSFADDLLVKYYDETLGISGENELNWYLDKARNFGGPVLDIACGTGRLSLEIASQGFELVGIDNSTGMLDRFRMNLLEQDQAVQNNVHIFKKSMSDFILNKKFNTIICVDAFFHNLTAKDEEQCLKNVAQHLLNDGRFCFNVPNPNQTFLNKCVRSKGNEWTLRKEYELDNNVIRVEQALDANITKQLVYTKLRFTVFDNKNEVIEEGESFWTTRYLFQEQYQQLFKKTGFEIDTIVGTYDLKSVSEESQLIYQLKLTS